MTRTTLLTTAVLLGFAGAATAGCFGDYESTTAKSDMSPILMADAEPASDLPALLLPLAETDVTDEG